MTRTMTRAMARAMTRAPLKKTIACVGLAMVLGVSCQVDEEADSSVLVWKVDPSKKWDSAAEREFSDWVERLGTGRANGACEMLGDCLKNPSVNSFYDPKVDDRIDVYADCADLPAILRSYFAFKTKRPYVYTSAIEGDRYTKGNYPVRWKNQEDIQRRGTNGLKKLFRRVAGSVHSGFFRTAPEVEKTDTYPISIDRSSVRPGTVFYDPNGHVLVVYKVEDNGLIRFIDGHPDNSLTTQTFGGKFARGGTSQGGGFRNFRPFKVSSRGKVTWTNNADLEDWSTEQYRRSYETSDGKRINYYKWIRRTLSKGEMRIIPREEMSDMLTQLCVDISDRVNSVNAAIRRGINRKPHPNQLPTNIYGTTGEWESYSTPSRDARLKSSVADIYNFVNESYDSLLNGTNTVVFDGSPAELIDLYSEIWERFNNSPQCQVSYQNSIGERVEKDLDDIMDSLFDLSFDPYHCIEMRWGAYPEGGTNSWEHPEFSTCPDGQRKVDWYVKENRLRNNMERLYGAPTPITLGPEIPADIHVPRLLNRLSDDLEGTEDTE